MLLSRPVSTHSHPIPPIVALASGEENESNNEAANISSSWVVRLTRRAGRLSNVEIPGRVRLEEEPGECRRCRSPGGGRETSPVEDHDEEGGERWREGWLVGMGWKEGGDVDVEEEVEDS